MSNLSKEALKEIKEIGLKAAWYASNMREWNFWQAGYDKEDFDQAAENLMNSGNFTGSLAYDIKWCAWNMAWLNVNMNLGKTSREKIDKQKVEEHCMGMIGDANGEIVYELDSI